MNRFATFAVWIALLANCTGTQHINRTWETNAGAAIVLAAHLVDGADSYAASKYAAEARAGADPTALDARFARTNAAIHLARPSLQASQSGIATVARMANATEGERVNAACLTLVSIREARTTLTHIAEAFAEAGLTDAPPLAEGINALVSTINAGPICAAGRP